MAITKDLRQRDQRESKRKSQPSTGKQPYRAYEISARELRYLEIRPKEPDPVECPSYTLLTHIRAEWRMGSGCTLEYGDLRQLSLMVIIRGDNLTELYRALKEWKVEWIAEFSPGEHEEPTDAAAPFIRSITIHSTRPETPPPANHRH